MGIVWLALRRPYNFVVMAILIAILGVTAIVTMPVDIFPYIDIPIVSVLWQYGGLSPDAWRTLAGHLASCPACAWEQAATDDFGRERQALERYLDSLEKADQEQQAAIDPSAVQAALEKLKQHPEPEARFMPVPEPTLPLITCRRRSMPNTL